ncbi:hypothetical protein [Sinomonas terrae]|uniref:CobW C-terminal domain-containing protein n=1 Tax=Sinomonas terrae TaxID=2908838 RepID=A0ABS9TXR4_9MICC|nr:hypothetical protein [Sinomonas terrae]MCH6469221.1 hypothetical protein [Sinomonas terrae]
MRLADLSDVHWSGAPGGHRARGNRPYLHGYVDCDRIMVGEIGHSCEPGSGPHRIEVCIVGRDNDATTMTALRAQASSPQLTDLVVW